MKRLLAILLILVMVLPIVYADKPQHVIDKQEKFDDWNDHWNFKTKYSEYDEEMQELREAIEALEYILGYREETDVVLDDYLSLTQAQAEAMLLEKKEALEELQGLSKSITRDLKEVRKELRNLVKKGYSQAELDNYEALKARIENRYQNITVLDIDSIISEGIHFKFDTPPVIKGGRTLIPVSALVKGFGAQVDWDPALRKVTITKDDTVIVIYIDSNVTYVNGKQVILDTEAIIMENRTIVPLRFIAETLGLKVHWNPDDQTIEIDDFDTSLTSNTDQIKVIDESLALSTLLTRSVLMAGLDAPENASMSLVDSDGNPLAVDDAPIAWTDQVKVIAENGYTTSFYDLRMITNDLSLTADLPVHIIDGTLVIPEEMTRIELSNKLDTHMYSSFSILEEDQVLDETTDPVLESNHILVTSEAGSTKAYPIQFETNTYSFSSTFVVKEHTIIIEETSTRDQLIASITVDDLSSFKLVDLDDQEITGSDVLLLTDKILHEKDVVDVYTLRYIDTDVSLTTTYPMMDSVITVEETTTRQALMDSITISQWASVELVNGEALTIDDTLIDLTDIILVTAEDGSTAEYTLKYPDPVTTLATSYSLDGTVISLPKETLRSTFEADITFTDGETYELMLDTEVLGEVAITEAVTLVVTKANDDVITYTFYILDDQTAITTSYPIDGTVITIDETTRNELMDSIIKPEKATITLKDSSDAELLVNDSLLLDTDYLVVTAEDGTEAVYTLVYDQSSTELILLDEDFALDANLLTIPENYNLALLVSGLDVEQEGTLKVYLDDVEVTETSTLITNEMVIVVTSGDTLHEATYTIGF